MDNDDQMVGTILSRRRALALLGTAGGAAALLAARGPGAAAASNSSTGTLPSCVVRPAMTEGPYFVDEKLTRSDIRVDTASKKLSAGVPLALTFLVTRVGTGSCAPLAGVMVDIWHCDAAGKYSDVAREGTGGTDFLRGQQLTGKTGLAKFTTIVPGWYSGRAVHIHFKLRTTAGASKEFTSQLFFDPATVARVYAAPAYSGRGSTPDTPNAQDGIYRNGGSQLLLNLTGDNAKGYAATFDVGMNLG
jgi:protocatechuate 3,4-dioxygenase beta subunit